ncbi:hypothetical protein [Streptomyces coffeae]|uniref:Uncharacterized protein n=1 Tax=Streptomyces coffeae TaxID=621382 RepID=A0ABS1NKN7_9ACTN|nr:hypothetical protein [Streptomyces coffeae]MBL1100671.1 hypothetical protein [Streptomyces coffeae]
MPDARCPMPDALETDVSEVAGPESSERCEPRVEDHPEALLSRHGAAWRVGGVVSAELIRRNGRGRQG